MNICSLFGHSNAPLTIKGELRKAIIQSIEEYKVELFFIGEKGTFDEMTVSILEELKGEYDFDYMVFISYTDNIKRANIYKGDRYYTTFPKRSALAPPIYAVCYHNKWVVKQSDVVISYVNSLWGNAARYVLMAKQMNKRIINIAKPTSNK